MRIVLTAAVAMTLTAGIADAQYKTTTQPPPPPASQTQTSPIQITMPNSTGMQVPAPVGDEELAKARRISRAEAMKMVKTKKAVYVDVRSKESYDESHIPGAISIPLSQLQARFKDLPPKKFLITYCA